MGHFAKWAGDQAENWKANMQAQVDRFRQHMPLTEEETTELAQKLIRERIQMAYQLGQQTRLKQEAPEEPAEFPFFSGKPLRTEGFDVMQGSGAEPGREIVVPLSKAGSSALAGFGQALRDYAEDAYKNVQLEKARGMAPTEDPASLPWFYAAQVKALPKAFMAGYQDAEKGLMSGKAQQVEAQLAQAKAEFENALHAERGQRKISSCGEFLDGLADMYEKQAGVLEEGDLSKLLGYYLAAATAIHGGADAITYNWLAKRDPRRLQAKALESAIKRRARETPQPVVVLPEQEQSATSPTDESLSEVIPNKVDSAEVQA